jgi:hypothetical protein
VVFACGMLWDGFGNGSTGVVRAVPASALWLIVKQSALHRHHGGTTYTNCAGIRGIKLKKEPSSNQPQAEPDYDGRVPKMAWTYGLAAWLPECRNSARQWSATAQLTDPAAPLSHYDPAKWDPTLEGWQELERCVMTSAAAAGTNLHEEWEEPDRGAAAL